MHNFQTAMSLTAGFIQLKEKLPSLWNWIPTTVQAKYDVLNRYYNDPKLIRELELSITEEPVIPFIGN